MPAQLSRQRWRLLQNQYRMADCDLYRPNPAESRESDWASVPCPRSGRIIVNKVAVRRVGIGRCQSRIEAEPRRPVGAKDRVRLSHIDVNVRRVLRRRLAYA